MRPSKKHAVAMKPEYMERKLESVDGPRYQRRPSYLARKKNTRRSSEVLFGDSLDIDDSWASEEPMPAEKEPADDGWQPGPYLAPSYVRNHLSKALHQYTPGPTNPALTSTSTEADIMDETCTHF